MLILSLLLKIDVTTDFADFTDYICGICEICGYVHFKYLWLDSFTMIIERESQLVYYCFEPRMNTNLHESFFVVIATKNIFVKIRVIRGFVNFEYL